MFGFINIVDKVGWSARDLKAKVSSVQRLSGFNRTDEANFDFSPISLIFSMNILHYIL